MALTPGQKQCVDTLVGPVAVSAGAGSGRRSRLPAASFIRSNAGSFPASTRCSRLRSPRRRPGEIKSRVKGALKACGRTDQALLVDSAWISTIHGACARMLRAHALDLGIAPDFTVADEAAANDMLDASLEEVLGSENDIISPGDYDALFTEYAARQAGSMSAASVEGVVRDIVVAAPSEPRRDGVHRAGALGGIAPPSLWRAWRLWRAISRRYARLKSRERPVMRSSTVRPVRSRGSRTRSSRVRNHRLNRS